MNIEKTISEHAVSDILTPMLESQDRIVTEDVAPLFDQATGLDTPHASGTVTTTIEESRSVITAIIRKAWTATLTMLGGASVISYIAAAYTYLRNRLQGNETYGIPDRRSEISSSSSLAANLALLNDRKIGGADCQDGMSLAQICCGTNGITKIDDGNHGWTCVRQFPNIFPSLKELTLNCSGTLQYMVLINGSPIEKLNIPEVTEILEGNSSQGGMTFGNSNNSLKEIHAESLRRYTGGYFASICNALEEFDAPSCEYYDQTISYGGLQVPNIKIFRLGTLTHLDLYRYPSNPEPFSTYLDLIHFEVGQDTAVNLDLSPWNPTNALDPTGTDLIEEGSTAQNNLQQFLSNFRSYIANRLTDNGSGKTLTLSQAVRNAIHAAESTYGIENIIITQKGWTISPAPN